MNLEQLFLDNKEKSIGGRYLNLDAITPVLNKLNDNNQLSVIGKSVLGEPIYKYQIGSGSIKIFMWSQMHGNESTTTKGLFDFLNLLKSGSNFANQLLNSFTFCVLPMLNPDGARLYTRVNANEVDLNRDSQELTQPESQILRATFEDFNPDFCYNLHDQRTIFGVDDSGNPATMSFLAPSFNEERSINDCRQKAINLIAGINDCLQKYIPGQVGRFDDSFNINCIGDTFQFLGVPTVLFEAGHFPEDYEREVTRKYVFYSLLESFKIISENDIDFNRIADYLTIPQNKTVFYDFIYRNVKINYDGNEKITNFAAQYKEELINNVIVFNAYIIEVGELEGRFSHYTFDAKGAKFKSGKEDYPILNQKANFSFDETVEFVNGLIKN